MLQPRIRPLACVLHISHSSTPIHLTLGRLTITPNAPSTFTQTRPASHATQGRANKAAPGPGKRLGAKKGDSEYVVPGNILFRQRGTHWFAGENCGMGRDHTIFSQASGFVRYYKDPKRHPDRKYIGVVLKQEYKLPRQPGAARKRRLGLDARVMDKAEMEREDGKWESIGKVMPRDMGLRDGYQYRESNASIGRTADRLGRRKRLMDRRTKFIVAKVMQNKKDGVDPRQTKVLKRNRG